MTAVRALFLSATLTDRYHVVGTGDVAVMVEAGAAYLIVGDTDTGYVTGRAGENGRLDEETGGVGRSVWTRDGSLYVRVVVD